MTTDEKAVLKKFKKVADISIAEDRKLLKELAKR